MLNYAKIEINMFANNFNCQKISLPLIKQVWTNTQIICLTSTMLMVTAMGAVACMLSMRARNVARTTAASGGSCKGPVLPRKSIALNTFSIVNG